MVSIPDALLLPIAKKAEEDGQSAWEALMELQAPGFNPG